MTRKIWWAMEPRGTGVRVLVAVVWARPRSCRDKDTERERERERKMKVKEIKKNNSKQPQCNQIDANSHKQTKSIEMTLQKIKK